MASLLTSTAQIKCFKHLWLCHSGEMYSFRDSRFYKIASCSVIHDMATVILATVILICVYLVCQIVYSLTVYRQIVPTIYHVWMNMQCYLINFLLHAMPVQMTVAEMQSPAKIQHHRKI